VGVLNVPGAQARQVSQQNRGQSLTTTVHRRSVGTFPKNPTRFVHGTVVAVYLIGHSESMTLVIDFEQRPLFHVHQ
jgi:hypothetical protein